MAVGCFGFDVADASSALSPSPLGCDEVGLFKVRRCPKAAPLSHPGRCGNSCPARATVAANLLGLGDLHCMAMATMTSSRSDSRRLRSARAAFARRIIDISSGRPWRSLLGRRRLGGTGGGSSAALQHTNWPAGASAASTSVYPGMTACRDSVGGAWRVLVAVAAHEKRDTLQLTRPALQGEAGLVPVLRDQRGGSAA